MSDKDNIKLKSDTLSTRKSGSPASGVHVKRKRKIIAKPINDDQKTNGTNTVERKQTLKPSEDKITPKVTTPSKSNKIPEVSVNDSKSSKKQKIDKDEKIEKMENKELHLKSPKQKKDKNKKNKNNKKDISPAHKFEKPTEPVKRDVKITQSMTVAELANQMALKKTQQP